MKAIIYTQYGKPEVVQVQEYPKPIPKENEVLVQVMASTVNRTDAGFRSAEYFISRFWSGLFKPNYPILGCEFAGIVEEIGEKVSSFKKGDKVFGFNDKTFGGHAEYLCIAESEAICTMPTNSTFEEAAAISEGAHYALCNIRASKVHSGMQVMVYGATGAIGSAAVQILKSMKVHVTAVCNTKNVALVQSLGADVVIDYEKEDYTQLNTSFDFIFDAVGKSSFSISKKLLKPTGIYISTELGKNGANVFLALLTPILGGKKVLFPIPFIHKEDVLFLKNLVEQNQFKPVLDKSYSFNEIVEAYQYVDSGQKTGNVILKVANQKY
jgi:NADPH:quinone reductase-like Zn-dependent oxidoreductase